MKKDKSQRLHAQRRAFQRFGLVLREEDQCRIVDKIRVGDARFYHKDSHRVSIFLVEHEKQMLKVVYDRERKQLASILPFSDYETCGCSHKHCTTPCGGSECVCIKCCCKDCEGKNGS